MTVLSQEEITVPAVPLSYIEIADDIAGRITAGEYPAGSKLPSYAELATLYSVSERTAARAYERLRLISDGRVVGSTGRGVFVVSPDE